MGNNSCKTTLSIVFFDKSCLTKCGEALILSSIESISASPVYVSFHLADFLVKYYIIIRNCSPLNQLSGFVLRCPQRGFVFSGVNHAF